MMAWHKDELIGHRDSMDSRIVSPRKIIRWFYGGYMALFIFFFLVGASRFPPVHIVIMQLMMWGLGFLFSELSLRNRLRSVPWFVFAYQLFCAVVITLINIGVYQEPLGFNPKDALFYRECGESFGKLDYKVFFANLVLSYGSLDDWGFPSLMWALYRVFGDTLAPWVLLLLNATAIAVGCKYLFSLSRHFIDSRFSKLVIILWGFMPFSVCTSVGGLKENIFAMLVILFFYHLYNYFSEKKLRSLLFIALFIVLLFLFRLSIGFAAIISVVVFFLLRLRTVRRYFIPLLVLSLLVGGLAFPMVVGRIASIRGNTLESVTSSASTKAESVGGTTGVAVNALSALVGPFPTFISLDEEKLQYITRYSFSPFLKLLISFFFYAALWLAFKKRDLLILPLFLFVLMNIAMLTLAFFALNMRFHWPHMPLFFLLSAYGYLQFQQRPKRKRKNVQRMPKLQRINPYSLYLVFSFFVIVFYNIR